ncbi:hypothetical protein BOTBODRAFT_184376 [Botryobasidium botryosum FD-172 SS1]|uniref:non-specific serine/threonine protein kinase n=1 Tax=Botryobasidium botryosum (strain FD-172 SS1) TaxID=930990 RepID=A0A067MXD7_BOTB1|nr:hypothetical protein BOTBODRAFT_184376 [Botryobasidium botryosum FD-172 SS1]
METLIERAKDALFQLQSILCAPSAKIKVNGRSYKILRILGEGGFSFVYLAQDETSGRQFALKKIRCPTGNEGVKEAMREVEAYRKFKHPNIIRILDSAVVQDRDGDGQIVYLFLPLYSRGNLQDKINTAAINNTTIPENDIMRLFKGTCLAVRAMHDYRAPVKSAKPNTNGSSKPSSSKVSSKAERPPGGTPVTHLDDEGAEGEQEGLLPSNSRRSNNKNRGRDEDDDEEDEDDPRHPVPDDEGEGQGFSYGQPGMSVPLMPRNKRGQGAGTAEVVFDGDHEQEMVDGEENANESANGGGERVLTPWAHRDIKPGNVMISDEGEAVLMDFGSAIKARVNVETRQQALVQQDIAAEQSTMPYRAPELFDVKTGTTLDEKVDIWSLGCTLFALLYHYSPFESTVQTEQGGSIAMAVLNAQYKHPATGAQYSEGVRKLIDAMLKVNPKDRPDIHQVIEMADRVLQSLR